MEELSNEVSEDKSEGDLEDEEIWTTTLCLLINGRILNSDREAEDNSEDSFEDMGIFLVSRTKLLEKSLNKINSFPVEPFHPFGIHLSLEFTLLKRSTQQMD